MPVGGIGMCAYVFFCYQLYIVPVVRKNIFGKNYQIDNKILYYTSMYIKFDTHIIKNKKIYVEKWRNIYLSLVLKIIILPFFHVRYLLYTMFFFIKMIQHKYYMFCFNNSPGIEHCFDERFLVQYTILKLKLLKVKNN